MEHLIKYPRTYHALFSEGATDDDKTLSDYSEFEGQEVVVTIKMDGENTSMYQDNFHARSRDSDNHPSRNWVKGVVHAAIKYNIPEGWRICGENVYALHSIAYENLDTYFYCFNIWNEKNECLSFDDTVEWCNLLDIKFVPVVWRGIFDLKVIENIFKGLDKEKEEGIVVRKTNSFEYKNFKKNYFKAVRAGHVQTDEHWMSAPVVPNKLKES